MGRPFISRAFAALVRCPSPSFMGPGLLHTPTAHATRLSLLCTGMVGLCQSQLIWPADFGSHILQPSLASERRLAWAGLARDGVVTHTGLDASQSQDAWALARRGSPASVPDSSEAPPRLAQELPLHAGTAPPVAGTLPTPVGDVPNSAPAAHPAREAPLSAPHPWDATTAKAAAILAERAGRAAPAPAAAPEQVQAEQPDQAAAAGGADAAAVERPAVAAAGGEGNGRAPVQEQTAAAAAVMQDSGEKPSPAEEAAAHSQGTENGGEGAKPGSRQPFRDVHHPPWRAKKRRLDADRLDADRVAKAAQQQPEQDQGKADNTSADSGLGDFRTVKRQQMLVEAVVSGMEAAVDKCEGELMDEDAPKRTSGAPASAGAEEPDLANKAAPQATAAAAWAEGVLVQGRPASTGAQEPGMAEEAAPTASPAEHCVPAKGVDTVPVQTIAATTQAAAAVEGAGAGRFSPGGAFDAAQEGPCSGRG